MNQYDLLKLGFQALEEDCSSDVMDSPYESWVPQSFEAISRSAEQGAGYQYGLVPPFYRDLMAEMDSNRDGKITAEEIRQALAVRDPLVKNVVNRLAVKHHSEWSKGRSTGRWEGFYEDLDSLEVGYCEKWQADLEWMSRVPSFDKDEAVWHFHPIEFLSALKTEEDCAKLIWGEVVNQRLGAAKACEFRKKIVKICAAMWGEKDKIRYADVLMRCMSVETNRMFTSSIVAYRKARHKNGDIIFISSKSGTRPKIELHVFTKEEIIKDKSIVEKSAVGLIQFTSIAVQQINIIHNLTLTKMQLALMDEIEQLDYVKLYFTSNKEKFDQIKSPEDVYTFIFCPEGVGKPNDAVLYSKVDNEKAYGRNASLDSTEHGNKGNNDGLIQKSELLARLSVLIAEGERYKNQCSCIVQKNNNPDWMPIAISEYNKYKDLIESDSVLNDKIKIYHDTTNAKGKDGEHLMVLFICKLVLYTD